MGAQTVLIGQTDTPRGRQLAILGGFHIVAGGGFVLDKAARQGGNSRGAKGQKRFRGICGVTLEIAVQAPFPLGHIHLRASLREMIQPDMDIVGGMQTFQGLVE